MKFQYSQGEAFCKSLITKTTPEEIFDAVFPLFKTLGADDYGAFFLKNATYAMYCCL
jgi:hypothetical protein